MAWWSRVRSMVQRVATGWLVPGAVLFASSPVMPTYSIDNSMSTLARFPWVWTCVQAIAGDLASLPLVAVKSTPGAPPSYDRPGAAPEERSFWGPENRESRQKLIAQRRRGLHLKLIGSTQQKYAMERQLVHDGALDTLYRPNAGSDGWLFRKQLAVDWLLTGNAFVWCPAGPASQAIYRLHPRSVRPIPGFLNVPIGYEVLDSTSGARQTLPPDQILHIRDVSWEDTVTAILGESPIRCLHDDLSSDVNIRETITKASARGRPDILFSAKGEVGPQLNKELKTRWEEATQKRDGSFFIGSDVQATMLSWTPEQFADETRANGLRDMILAVFGVPPTRAGLTTASYGGARQESRAYWENLRNRAIPFECAFSRLAAENTKIEHDYSSVEALQISYTERLMRVSTWVGLGADPLEAAAYEGFDDAPLKAGLDPLAAKPAVPIDRQPTEPQTSGGPQGGNAGKIAAALEIHLRAAEVAYAEVEDGAVDRRLFVRWQSERLFHDLTAAGVVTRGESPYAGARFWADEIAGIVDELQRANAEGAFARPMAERLTARIVEWLRTQPIEVAA